MTPPQPAVEPLALDVRRTFGSFASGLIAVTARDDGRVHGMTASAFAAVSLAPPLALVCISNGARMTGIIRRERRYGLSILAAGQEPVAEQLAGRGDGARIAFDERWEAPVVRGAVAHLVCDLVEAPIVADHTVFIGGVLRHDCFEREPLLYFRGAFL